LRLGTVDVGSNTVHLMVVDVEPGIAAQTAAERRWDRPSWPAWASAAGSGTVPSMTWSSAAGSGTVPSMTWSRPWPRSGR
jgi:hypothetical protein